MFSADLRLPESYRETLQMIFYKIITVLMLSSSVSSGSAETCWEQEECFHQSEVWRPGHADRSEQVKRVQDLICVKQER